MIAAALLLAAAAPVPVAGLYRTHQIEVGAALLLQPDGSFRYQLDYGAVSEVAEGRWTVDGDAVYLTATKMDREWQEPGFRRTPLKRDGDKLLLRRYETIFRFVRDPDDARSEEE